MTMQPDGFALAQQYHQAGELRKAEEGYRRILRADPRSVMTWFMLGELCEQDHRLAEAEACFRQASERIRPSIHLCGHLHRFQRADLPGGRVILITGSGAERCGWWLRREAETWEAWPIL